MSSPTTPKLPPTPPIVDEEVSNKTDEPEETDPTSVTKLASLPATPVNGNSPPTPDNTPPREQLKIPRRPYLALRPSIASTRAESFRTAHEQITSEDESEHLSPELDAILVPPIPAMEMPVLMDLSEHREEDAANIETNANALLIGNSNEHLPSSTTPGPIDEKRISDDTVVMGKDTPMTDFQFDLTNKEMDLAPNTDPVEEKEEAQQVQDDTQVIPEQVASMHQQVTLPSNGLAKRGRSLRDRLAESKQLQNTASTEAFANVIGWNDGVVPVRAEETGTNRWSDSSNPSAIEAYVVDSPIKPRKRGTLRKVVKNDSLRATSSPIPHSNRTSLQSTSDSPHRLVHKKQKLNNQYRWSTGSDISKRTLSWGSAPTWAKADAVKVAAIPEKNSSHHTSSSSSRRQSHSASGGSGHGVSSMPPVTTPGPRRKRAFSDSQDQSPSLTRPPQIPTRSSSLSAPTSRSGSRANSVGSQQFSMQREQAEKDLRTTLERMESERLSASLRRGSEQSDSPTPAPKHNHLPNSSTGNGLLEPNILREHSSTAGSDLSQQKPPTIEVNGITPGTKEWADLRPSTVSGTPFSQTSVMSASPEIIEAKVISFFPHNNESLQLIEPNRLSETAAVKALRGQDLKRANTVPESKHSTTTPRTSALIITNEDITVDSPLRNPRKPPEPPSVQFTVIPPTPRSELNNQLGPTPNTSPVKTRPGIVLRKRPSLQSRDRSESFIKNLSRTISLRNAKNPKADQVLDSTLYPFWRPRAFWDDDDYKRRIEQERTKEQQAHGDGTDPSEITVTRSVTIREPHQRMVRSNTITTGPVSLIRRMSERRRQKKVIDDHLVQQQALVKQTSYSSLQKFRAGRRLYSMPPLRNLSLNTGVVRLGSLKERLANARARREEDRLEQRRDKIRKSIGAVVMQSDSRFPEEGATSKRLTIEHMGGRRVNDAEAMAAMLENARAEESMKKRNTAI